MKIWLNHHVINGPRARISVLDHGFLYGDGIYETVRAYGGHIFRWADHFQRLRQSARLLDLRCPWSGPTLQSAVLKVLTANRQTDATVRITISRGEGPLGLDPRACPKPTLVIALHPARNIEKLREKGISAAVVTVRRTPSESLDSRLKSTNGLNQILARIEAHRMGAFEGILLNLKGHVTEGTASNVFFVKRGTIFTPAPSCGLLEGITRKVVLKLARRAGLNVREGAYRAANLLEADELFLTNSGWELMPVVKIFFLKKARLKQKEISQGKAGPVTLQLQSLFQREIAPEM